jgi:hypothetical protein
MASRHRAAALEQGVIVELAIPVSPDMYPLRPGLRANTDRTPVGGLRSKVVGISHWRTGAVAAVVTRAITTIIANGVRADDSEVEADVQDDQFHEPSGIHQCAERGPVAPTQPGQPGSDELDSAPKRLRDVVDTLAVFLRPVATASHGREPFKHHWAPPGPWRSG